VLPASRHWRLLQRIHGPGAGQLSQRLAALTPAERDTLRFPHPEFLQILDPRPLLDESARLVRGLVAAGSSMRHSLPVSTTGTLCGLAWSGMWAGSSPTLPKTSASPSTLPPECIAEPPSQSRAVPDFLIAARPAQVGDHHEEYAVRAPFRSPMRSPRSTGQWTLGDTIRTGHSPCTALTSASDGDEWRRSKHFRRRQALIGHRPRDDVREPPPRSRARRRKLCR
jgi:hypothetical protein